MKRLACLAAVFTTAVAIASPTVSDVIIRQQWPWKTDVQVDFFVSGVGGVSQVSLAAYVGDTFLGCIPQTSGSGDFVVSESGVKRILFDPTQVPFLQGVGMTAEFRLDVTIADLAEEPPLYLVFNLRKEPGEAGQVAYVTEHDLTNGVWGAWERNKWNLVETPIWTDVTNDLYKTTHLVVRRIPAGSFLYGEKTDSAAYYGNEIAQTTVMISKPYYIGVYPVTAAQYNLLRDKASTEVSSTVPDSWRYYLGSSARNHGECLRGKTSSYQWPASGSSVHQESIMGLLRARTGMDFDLPTEAQWEKAARGGSTGVYYSSNGNALSYAGLKSLADAEAGAKYAVGLFAPNAYGLYDVLGNAWDVVLDWYAPNYVPEATDPKGPEESTNSDKLRVTKGFTYDSNVATAGKNNMHLGGRSSLGQAAANGRTGYRVCCPAPSLGLR